MGSKHRLLAWMHDILHPLEFETALDAFSGSGCVSYLLKCMGKQVYSNDLLHFCQMIAKATVENATEAIDDECLQRLLTPTENSPTFIQQTFSDIFYTPEDLEFLDHVWANLRDTENPYIRAIAIAALTRSCVKRQPRGVFTVAGDPERYKDGRRDLRLTLRQHFEEQVSIYNSVVFDNGKTNRTFRSDIFDLNIPTVDLVYMDPPYVPRSDDNCYVKRYHFLEGLAVYWEGFEIMEKTKVKKIKKIYTPFSYRRTAKHAFDRMFRRFAASHLVLSYSSNGFPDLETLVALMERYKTHVVVHQKKHRYHFGTHSNARRNQVCEFLIVGT